MMTKPEEKMGMKQYAKFDKVFMIFGSLMNGVQGSLTPENGLEYAEKAWLWANVKVADLVEKMYQPNEDKCPF